MGYVEPFCPVSEINFWQLEFRITFSEIIPEIIKFGSESILTAMVYLIFSVDKKEADTG